MNWEKIYDIQAVHILLCRSDISTNKSVNEIPQRNLSTTINHVNNKRVWGVTIGSELVASFTLSNTPSFEISSNLGFPVSNNPVYLSRLCVDSRIVNEEPFLGLQAIKKAIEIAREENCDFIRCEVNPKIRKVLDTFLNFGFDMTSFRDGDNKRYLYRNLYD